MEDNDLNFIIDWRSCLQTLNPIDSNYQTFNVYFGENLLFFKIDTKNYFDETN